MSESKKDSKGGCIIILILLGISWGIPSLISGKGFFNGIEENITAGFMLGVIALLAYVVYKLFLEE